MKKLLLLVVAFVLQAEDLKSLLEYAAKNNKQLLSKSLQSDAKESSLASSKKSYFPTLDVGAFYQRFDDPSPFSPTATYSGFATLGVDIYDGGKRSHTIEQKREELLASKSLYKAAKKSTSLEVAENFFNYKILEAELEALKEGANAVHAQLQRTERFYDASLATSDDVSRLEAAYEGQMYEIDSLKFSLLELKKSLELKVGKEVAEIGEGKFLKEETKESLVFDDIEAMRYEKNAILFASKSVDAHFYPQIRLEDTYSLYGYDDIPSFGGSPLPLPENQNKLMATLGVRLFDFGVAAEAKEALRLNASALDAEIAYQTQAQEIQKRLSLSRITTATSKIKSAQSALTSAKSTLESITQKYNNSIVDNIVYLDALTSYTDAKARYEASLYMLELAYALHYYYNSQKLEEFLQ